MSSPKPPPQTLRPDDERKIQIFLERASSVVLESPVLDAAHWRRLVSLAEELGLSDEELHATVDDLRQRGVITKIDLGPPKPPPLPNLQNEDYEQAEPEQTFSLTPPPPPTQSRSTKPKKSNDKPAPDNRSDDERAPRYLRRAQAIIAEQRGFGARTHVMLAAAAEEMGLDEQAAAEVLQSLKRDAAEPPSAPEPPRKTDDNPSSNRTLGDELQDNRRWRVEGAPPPEPPPPVRKPEDIFRDYLSASLAPITDGVVPELLEQKFIKHATIVLGLAQTFARHLTVDEANEKGLRFASGDTAATSESTTDFSASSDEALCDINVKLFLEQSVPILALHRGINAKSRVLLNALATEFGLSDEQVERAIAAKKFRDTTAREDADVLQQERLVGYRELVQGALVSLPLKVLTFDIEENLRCHGEERHGIRSDLVVSTIRDVSQALDIRQISQGQAREHIEHLVDAKLHDNARLDDDVRTRIESEGKQWGLSAEQVTAIIDEQTRIRDKRHQAERTFTHGALLSACLAALVVAGFFGWVAMQSGSKPNVPPGPISPTSILPTAIVVDEATVDTEWWGEELEFSIGTARREVRSVRLTLIDIESKDARKRRAAYTRIVAELFNTKRSEQQRDLLMRVLALSYERDPDPDAIQVILDELLARVPQTDRELSAKREASRNAILAVKATVGLVAQASSERQTTAATELSRAIGRTIDVSQKHSTLEQQACEGVASRMYRLLITIAKTDAARATALYPVIAEDVATCLDGARVEKLNTDFLIAVLTATSKPWREYEPLLRDTVASASSINAVRVLEVYETTDDLELQALLAEAFIARIGKAPDPQNVASIVRAVRKSLGVAATHSGNRRLTNFLAQANNLLDTPRSDIEDPESVLAEIVALAYHNTLACAVAQGSKGDATFDTLAEQDPNELLNADETTISADDKPKILSPQSSTILNDRLRMLLSPLAGSVRRYQFLDTIAGFTDMIDDLLPQQAAVVGTYLLRKKPAGEYRAILPLVEPLSKWKQVRLAVADQLDNQGLKSDQLQTLGSKLLGHDFELGGSAGIEALRAELLASVLIDTKHDDVGERGEFGIYDDASQALYNFYVAQAQLFSAESSPEGSKTPSVVAKAMIAAQAKRLSSSKLATDGKQRLQQVEADTNAIDYLATNDLQELVLLDRQWLRLLEIDLVRARPGRRSEAAAIAEQLETFDRSSRSVLLQLRDGQVAILKMWLILNQAS